MRYWIWWNDLIQGPFELDELTSLKAFSEDLLVCMEDRQEWIPASRVADLSTVVEQLRGRNVAPSTPPPPPPKRSPTVTPLQGEFFGDPPGQEPLLESDEGPKGPFAYRPVTGESAVPLGSFLEGRATMPFHFAQQPVTTATAVLEMPRPKAAQTIIAPPRVIRESPIRETPSRESPVRKPVEKEPIPLNILETTPILSEPIIARDTAPSLAPSFDELPTDEHKPQWLPWIAGLLVALAVLASVGYWLIDRASTHSAISEADQMFHTRPMAVRMPVQPPAETAVEPTTGVVPSALHNLMAQSERAFNALLHGFSPGAAVGNNQTGVPMASPMPGAAMPVPANDVPSASAPKTGVVSSVVGYVMSLFSPHPTSVGNNPGGLPLAEQTPGTSSAMSSSEGTSAGTPAPGTANSVPLASAPKTGVVSNAVDYVVAQSRRAATALQDAFMAFFSHRKTPAGGNPAGVPMDSPTPGENVAVPSVGMAGSVPGAATANRMGATHASTSPVRSKVIRYTAAKSKKAAAAAKKKALAAHRISQTPSETLGSGTAADAAVTGSAAAAGGIAASATTNGGADSLSPVTEAPAMAQGQNPNPTSHHVAHAKPASGSGASPAVPAVTPVTGAVAAMPGVQLPGVAVPLTAAGTRSPVSATPAAAPVENPVAAVIPEPYTPPASASKPNPWKGKQNEAILMVQNKTLPKSKITVGNQARAMLQEMHEKELLHAAETGERLYLPDKLSWAALQEDGPLYRVYLNFLAMQANGERVQTRSYQFMVDLKTKGVRTEDPAAQQDLLTQPAELTFKHNPMASDIDSILGGVDTYNKHKVQLIIVKKNKRNREERKKIEAALIASQAKVTRAVLYFRKMYTEKALQNIAKAYEFTDLLKG